MSKVVRSGQFLKTWSLRSNSVTRHVIFNRTKIGEKCQNWKIKMRHFGWFSNNVGLRLRHVILRPKLWPHQGSHSKNSNEPFLDLALYLRCQRQEPKYANRSAWNLFLGTFLVAKEFWSTHGIKNMCHSTDTECQLCQQKKTAFDTR